MKLARLLGYPLLQHFHSKPKYLILYNAVLVRYGENLIVKLKAIRDYSKWAAVSRAVYLTLLKTAKTVNSIDELMVSILNLAYWRRHLDSRIIDILSDKPSSNTIYFIKQLMNAPPEDIVMFWEDVKTEKGLEVRVTGWNLEEFLRSNTARRIIPEDLIQKTEIEEIETILEKSPIYEQIRYLTQKLQSYLLSQKTSIPTTITSTLQSIISTQKTIITNTARILQSIQDATIQRIRQEADDTLLRGTRTQGIVGVAGLEIVFRDDEDLFVFEDFFMELAQYFSRNIGSYLTKLASTWLRRDYRIDTHLPGYIIKPRQRYRVIVGVDVSASISTLELKTFISTLAYELAKIRTIDFESSEVVFWSTRIERVEKLSGIIKKKLEYTPPSGGGTSPQVFFEYLEKRIEHGREKIVGIGLLTDGEFYIDEKLAAAFRKYAKKVPVTVAGITKEEDTASMIRKLGWKVKYKKLVF